MTEELLKETIQEICESELSILEEMMKEEPNIVPSPEFEQRMEDLINERYGYRDIKDSFGEDRKLHFRTRYLLVAILLLILGTSTVFAIEPLRERLQQFFYTVFPDNIFIQDESGKNEENKKVEWKKPSYVPKGYTEYDVVKDEVSYYYNITWINEDENVINYIQTLPNISITADGETPEDILIGNKKAKMIIDENENRSIFYEEDGMIYIISGEISKEELIKIMKSIR
jgi:hypothetical protein